MPGDVIVYINSRLYTEGFLCVNLGVGFPQELREGLSEQFAPLTVVMTPHKHTHKQSTVRDIQEHTLFV